MASGMASSPNTRPQVLVTWLTGSARLGWLGSVTCARLDCSGRLPARFHFLSAIQWGWLTRLLDCVSPTTIGCNHKLLFRNVNENISHLYCRIICSYEWNYLQACAQIHIYIWIFKCIFACVCMCVCVLYASVWFWISRTRYAHIIFV